MDAFWDLIVGNALVAGLLAIVALGVGRVWRNPAAVHLLWLAVLVKLFTPPMIAAEIPLLTGWMQRDGIEAEQGVAVFSSRSVGLTDEIPLRTPSNAVAVTNRATDPATVHEPNTPRAPQRWSRIEMIVSLWACGSGAVAAWYGYRIARFRGALGDAAPAPPNIVDMATEISGTLGLASVPRVLMTGAAVPPLVWSMGGRPTVYLPRELFERLSRDAQATVLAHELAHVQRRDYLVRLLELAATTAWWWHPAAWLACQKLRELEEECCDGRVVEAAPHQARTYAAALVETLDFLSRRGRVAVPLPTAMSSTGFLTRRIKMLKERGPHRLTRGSALLAALMAALPLAVSLAGAAEEKAGPADDAKNPAAVEKSSEQARSQVIIEGQVTNEAGEPLADALVKLAMPAMNMRFVHNDKYAEGVNFLETKTDAEGNYKLAPAIPAEGVKVSFDVMKPGYRSLAGTLMMGGDQRDAELTPGKRVEESFELKRALYVKGVVVGEDGKPVPGAGVFASAAWPRSTGGVQITATGSDGAFEIFNFPVEGFGPMFGGGEEKGRGAISVSHPDYLDQEVPDVYAISDEDRRSLRIELPTGRKAVGRVVDAEGRLVAGVMVEAQSDAGSGRKAVRTDAEGRFELRGLVEGDATLVAHDMGLKQKAKLPLELDRDHRDVELRLEPIVLTERPAVVEVLGMKLTDLTPELSEVYEHSGESGALILDPGADHSRLDIETLAEGNCFWMVGKTRVGSVREFVEQIVKETAGTEGDGVRCRVVYNFSTADFVGTNTQHLKLTQEDLRQLREMAANWGSDKTD